MFQEAKEAACRWLFDRGEILFDKITILMLRIVWSAHFNDGRKLRRWLERW
jgi:hypothetical protein